MNPKIQVVSRDDMNDFGVSDHVIRKMLKKAKPFCIQSDGKTVKVYHPKDVIKSAKEYVLNPRIPVETKSNIETLVEWLESNKPKNDLLKKKFIQEELHWSKVEESYIREILDKSRVDLDNVIKEIQDYQEELDSLESAE